MGIMNKMKTVSLRDLTWLKGDNFFQADTSNLPIKYVAISATGILQCDGYTATNLVILNSLDNSIAVSDASRHCIRIRVSNQASTSVDAFLASEGDKTITYETIDSVEEKIAGLKDYAVNLLDGSKTWRKYGSGTSHTFYIPTGELIPSVKSNVLQAPSTRLYRAPWVKMNSLGDIDNLNNGVYALWTSSIIVTILSCNTVEEAKVYLNAHPILIGYPTENGTHTSTLITQTEEII